MISTRDIGRVAAKAFVEDESFKNKIVRLAGDEFTVEELQKIYQEVSDSNVALVGMC
jgi:uncharacterized protein YbjT (DUF2867 family)